MTRSEEAKSAAVAVTHQVPKEYKGYLTHIHNNGMCAVIGFLEIALSEGLMNSKARDRVESALEGAKKLNREMNLMLI